LCDLLYKGDDSLFGRGVVPRGQWTSGLRVDGGEDHPTRKHDKERLHHAYSLQTELQNGGKTGSRLNMTCPLIIDCSASSAYFE
jgi:hypothetical protein